MSSSLVGTTAILVDEHPMWVDMVEPLVQRAGVDVRAKLSRPTDALERLRELRPDLMITGIEMPVGEMDGLELVRRARAGHPDLKTLVLSMHDDPEHVNAAFAAGADAYVLKTAHPDDITSAVRQTFHHSIFVAPIAGASRPMLAGVPDDAGMTPREVEILVLVADGQSNAQVASRLCVTEQTVKFHLSNIYRKLGVANRTEASRWAQMHGVLSHPTLGAAACA